MLGLSFALHTQRSAATQRKCNFPKATSCQWPHTGLLQSVLVKHQPPWKREMSEVLYLKATKPNVPAYSSFSLYPQIYLKKFCEIWSPDFLQRNSCFPGKSESCTFFGVISAGAWVTQWLQKQQSKLATTWLPCLGKHLVQFMLYCHPGNKPTCDVSLCTFFTCFIED